MNSYSKETYGEHIAAVYDDWFAEYDSDAIDVLAELAQGGRALELGIGTGRFALPLSAKGVEVHGVDAATSMVARLKEKPGADRIAITMGNFADVPVDGKFALIYIVFNTFFALSSQEEQVRCFRNIASHLQPGGCFVMEAFVPEVARFTAGQVNRATKVTTDEVQLDVSQHDAATQRVNSQRIVLTEGNVRLYPVQIRYCWPSELDLMAQLVGLRLRTRWENWKREPFTSKATSHISIYE
jgi:SAM-dependent methyltransferase